MPRSDAVRVPSALPASVSIARLLVARMERSSEAATAASSATHARVS
jgi:hypothetical protein